MTDDRNPFDDATAVADQAELQELQKPKRNFANVVKRDRSPSQPAIVPTPAPRQPSAPAPRQPSVPRVACSPHVIRRHAGGLPEDSSEVLLTPVNMPQGKSSTSTANYPAHNGVEEFTVEEGRPQPPAAMVDPAEQASLAVAPPDDPDRGFLVITAGNDAGRRVGLPEGRTTIGRGIDCDIVLTDITVSRRHMYVERRDNVYFLCDLSSGNGTFVNNQNRRGEVVVVNGDSFQIGNTVFSFEGPDAQEAAATSNWQASAVPSGKARAAGIDSEEESTVAGKGLASARELEPMESDPPSELPTNIVASVEVEPQLGLPSHSPPPQMPPQMPQEAAKKQLSQEAALAALDSIVHTPPPGEESVIPLETGDLPELSVPPTPSPAIPYPVPGRMQSGGHMPPTPMPPSGPPQSVPGMQGHMGIAPMQHSPGGMPMQPGYPMPGSMPQGSSPMMGRPMLAGGRQDYHNPYPPAKRPAEPAPKGKLLIGIISVALVLTAVGIVAAVVSQSDSGDKEVAKTETPKTENGAETKPAPNAVAEAAKAPAANGADGGAASAEAPTPEPGPKTEPILVASLIAGNTQLPASTWGNEELSAPDPEPEPEPTKPEPEPEPTKPEPEPTKPEPEVRKPEPAAKKPEPKVARSNPRNTRKQREPKARTRPEPRDEPKEDPPKSNVDISSAKSTARGHYKRRDFGKAAQTLERAASRIDDDNDAMRLGDIADAYKKVGNYLEKAERAQSSNPVEALSLYKKALSQDKKYASSALSKLFRLRIGQVAPKAARALMARGKLPEAKKAADDAKRNDEGQAVAAVYSSLERKANSLIKKALKAKKKGDDDEAKDLLRQATKIAPKGTSAYDKCREELRRF